MNEDLINTNKIINSDNTSELLIKMKKNNTNRYFFSSNFREKDNYPSVSDFSIRFMNEIHNITSIKLTNFNILLKKNNLNKNYIFRWSYSNKKRIPAEKINTIKKVDDYFKLNNVLFGYTKPINTQKPSIFINFKNETTILLSFFSGNYHVDDLETLINDLPIKLSFVSIDYKNIFNCYVTSIESINNITDTRLTKMYKLNIISEQEYTKPFLDCFKNNGRVLIYLYNFINETTINYIPSKYRYFSKKINKYFLVNYDEILKNPCIKNKLLFGDNYTLNNIDEALMIKYKNSEQIVFQETVNIDLPDNNYLTAIISEVGAFSDCKKQLEEKKYFYEGSEFIWKFNYNKNLISMSHYKKTIATVISIKNSNKIQIKNCSLKKNDIVLIDNHYFNVNENISGGFFYYSEFQRNDTDRKRDILIAKPVYIKKTASKLLEDLDIKYSVGPNWFFNNYNTNDKVKIENSYIYGYTNKITIQVLELHKFCISDKIGFISKHLLFGEYTKGTIIEIVIKDKIEILTIDLGTLFIGEDDILEYTLYDLEGHIFKLQNPIGGDEKMMYMKVPDCNSINIINNPLLREVFAIINKGVVIGAETETGSCPKKLDKFSIKLVNNKNICVKNIKEINFILDIEQGIK